MTAGEVYKKCMGWGAGIGMFGLAFAVSTGGYLDKPLGCQELTVLLMAIPGAIAGAGVATVYLAGKGTYYSIKKSYEFCSKKLFSKDKKGDLEKLVEK